ncbi:Inner membrane transport protein YeaN [Moraxella caprae]|uniref:Inner membrane transport protein YeaN n=1 Tax=Moraxella caprae TaxID=90240 RepID=A0A378QWR1_9GAMM|nr:MFS transporter [Moraxella caprae]STZ07493.1 Inner membrane transport protein YeaN [Moraxella caprae]
MPNTPHSHKSALPLALLIITLVLLAINMRSPIVMLGSVAPTLTDALGLSVSAIGLLGSLPMPMFAFGALVAPMLAKRFGLEVMMMISGAVLAVGVLSRVWLGVSGLFVGTVVLSLAIGLLNALTAPFIKKYVPNHIALATGVFSLSMSVCAGLCAYLVVPLMGVVSWQVALSWWGVFAVMAFFMLLFINKLYHADTAQTTSTPSHFNAWKSKDAWYLGVYMGIQSLLFYTVASFLPSIGIGYGLNLANASGLALAFQLSAPVAIFLLTFLIKRNFPIKIIALVASLANVVGSGGLIWFPDYLMTWSALMGFGGACIFTLSLMLFSIRTTRLDTARDLSGMVQAVGYGVAFFGPLVLGKLYEKTGTWELSLYVLFILMCVNVGFGWLAGRGDRVD